VNPIPNPYPNTNQAPDVVERRKCKAPQLTVVSVWSVPTQTKIYGSKTQDPIQPRFLDVVGFVTRRR